MPFTPKFVDLVRNLTAITGTGPVTLGSAVNGFTSLAAAVSVGEQFYYCIQGLDKPAEREVGRGTMQANGTIARQAISGALTNFTTGAKTIAMVAAAEWFTRLEDVVNNGGSGGAAFDVATRAALAARTQRSGGVQLTEAGREGVFTFSTANLSAKVAADVRQGIYVAPSSDPSGAGGAWVRRHGGPVNVMWFGAKADFVTDDLPAFEGALATIQAEAPAGFRQGNRLFVPAGRYYLSASLNLHSGITLEGAGSAQPFGAGTILRFGKNVDGLIINHATTHGTGLGTQGDGAGSMIEGFQLWGGNVNVNPATGVASTFSAGDSITGHGVRIRGAFVACKDVASYFWGGDGFNILASSAGSDATLGNANSFYLERCQSMFNRGNGYLVAGIDANAGKVTTCSAISNGGAGFLEYSFLGNSYDACHVRDCGIVDPTGSNGPTGTCRYPAGSSTYYYMKAGQEVLAKTTVPGTNETVWGQFGGHPQCKAWAAGLEWVNGSPYATNPANSNGRNVFTGCYAESAQPPVQATAPSLFVGGLLDEVGLVGTASWVRAGGTGLSVRGIESQDGSSMGVGGKIAAWDAAAPGNDPGTIHFRAVSDIPNAGAAITFGARQGDPAAARAGIYTLTDPAFGARMYLATTDSFEAGAQTALAIDEEGNVNVTRGKLSIGGVPVGIGPVRVQGGTAYTAAADDGGAYIRFTNGAATALTVPPNSAVGFAVGTVIEIEQAGAGALSVVAGAGVTINSRGGDMVLAGQYAVAALKKVAADSWTLTGDL